MATVEEMHARIENDFGFHPANGMSRPLHEATRIQFKAVAHWIIDSVPAGREQSLALTTLQEAQMWTNAAIACNLALLET